jgi:hypothetical protein
VNTQFKIWPVLRDVIIVTVLTGLGGFIVGFASTEHNTPLYIYSLALSNSLFCIIGFTISGCLAVGNRWRHLVFVAAIVWAVSIFNVIFFGLTIIQWAASVVAVAIFALIGGGVSMLFKRKTLVEISSNAGDEKFYQEVARELQEKPMVPGLWTKAFAEMGGDDAKARALYIKYRFSQLATTANQEQSVKQAQVSKAKKQQVISAFRRYAYLTVGWILTLFGCLLFVAGMAMIYSHFYPSSPSDRDEGLVASGICFLIVACAFASLGFLAFVKAGIKFTSR